MSKMNLPNRLTVLRIILVPVCMIFIILPRATVSAKRINEVLQAKNSITDGRGNKQNKKTKGDFQ